MSGPVFNRKSLRGTWSQALSSLAFSVLFVLTLRWAVFEPYLIPSGSMIPSLLIHDHIFVNKLAYGIRVPFSSQWLWRFSHPSRGDVVVFRSIEDDSIFMVKRVIGLPGDHIRLEENGSLILNGEKVPLRPLAPGEVSMRLPNWTRDQIENYLAGFEFAEEDLGQGPHLVMWNRGRYAAPSEEFTVPDGYLFFMGDNRDNSSDSRVWGALPADRVLGRASVIWLSCEETLPEAGQLCNPKTIRWKRLFEGVQ